MAAESSDAHPGAIERLERLLRESEERYALVSAAVAEGTYDWNIEDNSLVVSPRLMGIFSFTGAALTSGDWTRGSIPTTGKTIAPPCAIASSK